MHIPYFIRKWSNRFMILVTASCAFLSIGILGMILYYVFLKGYSGLNLNFFTKNPLPMGEVGGGIANSILGTFYIVGVALIMGLPLGIGAGLYLAEYGKSYFASILRFVNDILNALPSIVVGLFAYAVLVKPTQNFSGFAGAVALAILMLPLIARTTEEVVKLVPSSLKEAALALGIPQWKVILSVVLREAKPGIITGVVLAIARAAGETAPLILTIFGAEEIEWNLMNPMSAMTLQIYKFASNPDEVWNQMAWSAALVLVIMNLLMSLVARYYSRFMRK